MAPFLKSKTRKKRQRAKSAREDRRTTSLRLAGLDLLTGSDFENISVAQLAKDAGCSVGAFYYRYADKSAYLKQLIAATFGRLSNNFENRFVLAERKVSVSDFVSHVVTKLSIRENAGIIRATLKLGSTEPSALRPYEEYKARVAAEAESVFKRGSKKKIPAHRIKEACQLLFATINDAILMPNSAAMELGSKEMAEALCAIFATHLGIKPEFTGHAETTGGQKQTKSRSALSEAQNANRPAKLKRLKKRARVKRTLL